LQISMQMRDFYIVAPIILVTLHSIVVLQLVIMRASINKTLTNPLDGGAHDTLSANSKLDVEGIFVNILTRNSALDIYILKYFVELVTIKLFPCLLLFYMIITYMPAHDVTV